MFYMILPNNKIRNDFIEHLRVENITATFHYLPLDSSKMGVKIKQEDQQDCPVSQSVSDCLVRLPLYFDLNTKMQNKIIESVLSFKI